MSRGLTHADGLRCRDGTTGTVDGATGAVSEKGVARRVRSRRKVVAHANFSVWRGARRRERSNSPQSVTAGQEKMGGWP